MNIRDLEYLVALSEYKHFRRAAEACHVSQPTLSGQIRKLEDELGMMLLERTSRKVLFTQSGLVLVDQVKKILLEVKILKEMAENQGKAMTGPLHLGVIPTIGPYLLPHIVPIFKSCFPDLELYLYEAQTAQLLQDLEIGKIDCAILARVKETENFIEVPTFKEKMLLAVSEQHPWSSQKTIDLQQLHNQEILILDDGHCLRDHTLGYCFVAGAKENIRFKATSLETLRNMVMANIGITFMPELAIDHKQQGIKYLSFNEPEPIRDIVLVYRPGSPLRERYERIAKAVCQAMKPILR